MIERRGDHGCQRPAERQRTNDDDDETASTNA
jgi:hypothetical protein